MEGYTDVLMAHLFGFTSAVAGMGTAFTPEQAQLLARHATKVILLYDGDAAGRTAAEKALDLLLEHGLDLRVAILPEGRDVDEVLLEEGADRLTEILDAGLDVFDFKVSQLGTVNDLTTERGRAASAAEEVSARECAAAGERAPMERDLLFVRRIADRLGVEGGPPPRRGPPGRDRGEASGRPRRRPAPGDRWAAPPRGPLPRRRPRIAQRARDLLMEQERLIAGAIYAPEHLAAIRSALDPADIVEDGRFKDTLCEVILGIFPWQGQVRARPGGRGAGGGRPSGGRDRARGARRRPSVPRVGARRAPPPTGATIAEEARRQAVACNGSRGSPDTFRSKSAPPG